ncbi:MAG TPA: hypothetical protein VLT35_06435 [Methanocella sp.]|nr:hypothetical protein [Methanocella sp.]
MERRLTPPEKFFIASVDQYLALLKAEQVRDCFSGLEYLAHRESFSDRAIVVRANIAELIRARYSVTKRAFYGANRSIEFTSQTVLDVGDNKL